MKLRLQDGLPYVSGSIVFRDREATLHNILIDTGSAGTIFSADKLLTLGIAMEPNDPVSRIRGVGGTEFVFMKKVDIVSIGDLKIRDFVVEVGAMDYGFAMDGIIGMNFLSEVGAILDLSRLEIHSAAEIS